MRRSILTYLLIGLVFALGTIALGWWFGQSKFISSVRWQIAAVIMLGGELVFLLFISANKGGQQFGPHGGPSNSPVVSAGADFYDAHPSRRLGDYRWLLIGSPILIGAIVMLVTL